METTTIRESTMTGIGKLERPASMPTAAHTVTRRGALALWAPRLAVSLACATAVVAQGSHQWIQARAGSWGVEGIAVAPTTPATVLIADGFHLYRSTNAGGSWATCSYAFGTFPGDALAFDPVNPSIAYGGRSHGMVKSIDGGATWFHLPNLNAGPGARTIAINPINPNEVYVGVSHGWGVYKSVNAGATWSNPLSGHDVQALAVNPANPQILLAGTRNYYSQPGSIMRSANGGQTWTTMWPNVQINAMAIDPINSQVAYAGAEAGGVFKSTSAGVLWTAGGAALANVPVSALIVDPSDNTRLFAATRGNGVYLSTDAGANWTSINFGLTDLNCLCMALHAPTQALFVGTYSGYVFVGMPSPSSSSATAYGAGCGSPVLTLAPVVQSPPIINTTARAALSNCPSSLAFLAVGFSNTSAGPFPLPMSLALYGMTGCSLLQSMDVPSYPLAPTVTGTSIYSLSLPNWGGLLGVHLYLQGWAVAPGANPANVTVSNGVEWVIGSS
jgi:photosystem II stability/assembly factor-like uncharacterized protein